MKTNRGFTLIEVLIAAGVLACGLVAVAAVFSFAIRTNETNRQMAAATALAAGKMEELRSAPFSDPVWTLTSASETIVVAGDRFTREWEIDSNVTRMITVVVYAERNALTRRRMELIRLTTLASPEF